MSAVLTKKKITWDVIKMDDVPPPPVGARCSAYYFMYVELKKLPRETPISVPCSGRKEITAIRAALARMAEHDKLRILSSRSANSDTGYFWLAAPPPEKPSLKK